MTSLINDLGGTVGFGEFSLDRNDDSSAQGISLTAVFGDAGLNFFGTNYSYVSINNNGNITLSNSSTGGLTAYTPFGLANGGYAIIAPFFADADTRLIDGTADANQVTPTAGGTSTGSDLVWYDLDPTGYGTLTVTWDDVGYFDWNTDKLNAFQLQIIGRGNGDFNIVFRYENIDWTTGDFSGGYAGLGGTVARAGFSTGDGQSWYELAQSGFQDAMLALESTAGNTGISGYYTFSVSSGTAVSESLMGTSGDDLLSGADGDDALYGFGGNDYLIGNSGADTLVGGGGNDSYTVDEFDAVVEGENEGIDSVLSGVTYALGANLENLQLTGSGTISGTGNALSNVLSGNAADNTLNGMGGNDTVDYSLGTSGITIDLSSALPQYNDGQGNDTLISIESVIGSIYGDNLTGTAGANVLNGNLDADTMAGGAGNDIYLVDNVGDIVTELAGQGIDTVKSAITYTLTATVERLTLTGTAAINGTGNELNNVLTGNSAANALNGLAGNDIYVVDNVGDIVTELAGQGIDTVKSAITYTLTANVERLTLTGTSAINGTGTGSNNILTGNGAANKLNGLAGNDTLIGNGGNDTLNGGSGKDTMKGGTGNDTYLVDYSGDIVTELAGQGIDTVKSGVTYALTANVERLTLTGTKAISGTGNGSNNILTGNGAANKLNGLTGNDTLNGGGGNDTLTGGTGKDALTGGLGNDFFVFNAALSASTNIDTLKDYTAAADTIRLENSIFTKLTTTGVLNAANFVVGTAAADANDFIVYNNSTGALYYDADGSGAGAATQFATVYSSGTTPATLSAAEFVVI